MQLVSQKLFKVVIKEVRLFHLQICILPRKLLQGAGNRTQVIRKYKFIKCKLFKTISLARQVAGQTVFCEHQLKTKEFTCEDLDSKALSILHSSPTCFNKSETSSVSVFFGCMALIFNLNKNVQSLLALFPQAEH